MKDLDQKLLRELLDYNPDTGELRWRERSTTWFKSVRARNAWNARYAGTLAFTAVDTSGYNHGSLLGKTYRAHQIIWLWMTGVVADEIDHQDHDKNNNRWLNLHATDRTGNNRNSTLRVSNTTGHQGVTFDQRDGLFIARICHKGKRLHLGSCKKLGDAVRLYEAAKAELGFHPNHGRVAV